MLVKAGFPQGLEKLEKLKNKIFLKSHEKS